MYCSSCGTKWSEIKMRCPECRRFTPALWLNLYSLSLLIVLALTNYMYLWKMVPIVATMATGLGFALPLAMRIYIHLVNFTGYWGLPLLILAGVGLVVLRRKKMVVPGFVKSGKLLAVVTWVALVFSLVGIFVGYLEVLIQMPRFIR